MFGRKVLWRASRVFHLHVFFLSLLEFDIHIARFIESALHFPYSTSFLALPWLVLKILGIIELLSRMGEDCLYRSIHRISVNRSQVVGA